MLRNSIRYHYTYELTKPDGVVPARRPVNDVDFALEAPFGYPTRPKARGPVAAIVHAFYPDELDGLLTLLRNVPVSVDLFISTDTEEKRSQIAARTANWDKGSVEIRVVPNRGRDIAAKFVGFRDVYEKYDLFLHLHIKKSPHGGTPLSRWRNHLFNNLLGSPEIVSSILTLFDDPKLGIVFPQHLFEIRGVLNWGYNYALARTLMRRLGVEIDKNHVLEFPSGSMFWGRSEAIRSLLDAGLTYDDFPEESGQVDGTLAHAIERIVLMAVEARGFEWLKVVKRELYPLAKTVLPVRDASDIPTHRLKVFQPCLSQVDTELPPYARTIAEARSIPSYPSRNVRPRLNLIVPTINPEQSFGGIATALKCFDDWASALGDSCDRRILVTDAEIEANAYRAFPDYTPVPFIASLDQTRRAIVDLNSRDNGRLDLRDREMFVATAWWTVDIIRDLERDRARYFGRRRPFVYLIQDNEPNFYGWSSKSALAEATYRHSGETIAVVNSEELYETIVSSYRFRASFCLPYVVNAQISAGLAPRPRERLILVYGRPFAYRNAFEIICEALKIWQQRDPIRASEWTIKFLGEKFEAALLHPLQNATVEGKVSLDAYTDNLNRASVGISLMISPHPSYPPLEMAEAGLETITNAFPGKDLRSRFPEIVSIQDLLSEPLAFEIEAAVARSEAKIGAIVPRRRPVQRQSLPGPIADPAAIAALIQSGLE